jgi:hypothetical protein
MDPEPDPDWIRIQEGKKVELQFSIKKRYKKIQLHFFSSVIIGHQNPGSGFNESGSTTPPMIPGGTNA